MIENDQVVHVREAKSGNEAWIASKLQHQQSSLSSRIRVMKKLFKMELQRGASMQLHMQKMFELLDELIEMDAKLDDDVAVSAILASVGPDMKHW